MDTEQQPIPDTKLMGWKYFAGIFGSEHVAATEFVFGATFVSLGARASDVLIGLLVGNLLATLSWTLLTAPIATQTRLSLYTYLGRIAGKSLTQLYNWANVVVFLVISAAMVTVSAAAVRHLVGVPAQVGWYPTDARFVAVCLAVSAVVVAVIIYGFEGLAKLSTICAPWLFVIFVAGGFALFPALSAAVLGKTQIDSFGEFVTIAQHEIWTGVNDKGEPGLRLMHIIGFAWAANSFTHFGLIDMALFRYAKKPIYGLASSVGMMFGHYVAWCAAGVMGAGAAYLMKTKLSSLDPGDVAYAALGATGYLIVIIAGWTTGTANLYRAGIAAQAIFTKVSRRKIIGAVGALTAVMSCFPFVYSKILPVWTYCGLVLVPVGGIVFAEHFVFRRLGLTPYWARYKGLSHNTPARLTWLSAVAFGFLMYAVLGTFQYYAFLPTWLYAIVVYALLASRFGARESFERQIEADRAEQEAVRVSQREQAPAQPAEEARPPAVASVLSAMAWLSLFVIAFYAVRILTEGHDLRSYAQHKEIFFDVAFVASLAYFSFSIWALRVRERHCATLPTCLKDARSHAA